MLNSFLLRVLRKSSTTEHHCMSKLTRGNTTNERMKLVHENDVLMTHTHTQTQHGWNVYGILLHLAFGKCSLFNWGIVNKHNTSHFVAFRLRCSYSGSSITHCQFQTPYEHTHTHIEHNNHFAGWTDMQTLAIRTGAQQYPEPIWSNVELRRWSRQGEKVRNGNVQRCAKRKMEKWTVKITFIHHSDTLEYVYFLLSFEVNFFFGIFFSLATQTASVIISQHEHTYHGVSRATQNCEKKMYNVNIIKIFSVLFFTVTCPSQSASLIRAHTHIRTHAKRKYTMWKYFLRLSVA